MQNSMAWDEFTRFVASVANWHPQRGLEQHGRQMAASATPSQDMCLTPQQTAEVNASHSKISNTLYLHQLGGLDGGKWRVEVGGVVHLQRLYPRHAGVHQERVVLLAALAVRGQPPIRACACRSGS